MPAAYTKVVLGFEWFLGAIGFVAGLIWLWRYVVSPKARLKSAQPPLPVWEVESVEFLLFLGLVVFGGLAFVIVASYVARIFDLKGDVATIANGAAMQFGMLAGVLSFAATVPRFRSRVKLGAGEIFGSGVITFVISLPVLWVTGQAWEHLLELFGLPAEKQDLIRMFAEAKSLSFLASLVLLATLIAPVMEELVFRAGIFRFLRSRAPRSLAFFLPALIFAALHVNWSTLEGFASFVPLIVLALLFSIAYERTGNIGTTIVAHALFNLNTIALILCGVATS